MLEQATLVELYEIYKNIVYYSAYNILHDTGAAEDAVQNVFIKLLKCKNNITIEEVHCNKTRSFMVIVSSNVAKSMYKKRKEKGNIPVEDEKLMLYVDIPGDSLVDAVVSQELYHELYDMISALDPQTADILRLKYFHDMRNTDIAALLGLSQIDIGVKIMRGKKKLKVLLEKGGMPFDA